MARFILMLVVVGIIVWAIYATVRYLHYKRLMEGLHEPELWLPRRERQAHARKLLRREDDEYTQQLVERTMRNLQEKQ